MTLLQVRHSLKLSKAEVSRKSGLSVWTIRKLEQRRYNVQAHKMVMLIACYGQYGIDTKSLSL